MQRFSTTRRFITMLALATAALAAAACGSTNAGAPAPAASIDPDAPSITAQDLRFTTSEVTVPAGTPFRLAFVNLDSAPHNVSIYRDTTAGQSLFQGEIFSGATRVYTVPALAAGSYFFRCDVHPDMTGTIVAN